MNEDASTSGADGETKQQRQPHQLAPLTPTPTKTVTFNLENDDHPTFNGVGRHNSGGGPTTSYVLPDVGGPESPRSPAVGGKFRSSFRKKPATDQEIATTFLRNDSIIIRVKPGQTFTEFAPIVVDSLAKNDPRLGTLGELRHLLRIGSKNQVKKFLRHNHWTSGHRIRAELWKELCRDANAEAQKTIYRETIEKIRRSGNVCVPTMLAAPNMVKSDHQLKENGKAALMQLLTAIEHVRPDFSYIPILYPLTALFLHYMPEEDAFACIMKLLSHSQKFLMQTDIASNASKRTLLVLVKKHISRAYILFKKITGFQDDKDLVPIFDEYRNWIFRDLPFTHLVRVVDCFLYEGQKVLIRVTMALVQLWAKEASKNLKSGSGTCKDISADISDFCRSISMPAAKLLKSAFSIRNLKMSYIRRIQEKHELKVRSRDSGITEVVSAHNLKQLFSPHHYIDATLPSKILSQAQSIEVIRMLPARFQLKVMKRLFATDVDGTSFTMMWNKIDDFEPTILIIKTTRDEIFGAFCSESWGTRRKTTRLTYFGTGESFLFKFNPDACKYAWVGTQKTTVDHKEELFQAADGITLFIGGGGLAIQGSLEGGSSETCPTFDNPPLATEIDFKIDALEVFGFVEE